MSLRTGDTVPYAPPATVMQVLNAFRDRGLTTPITGDVLLRASINESLVSRTLRSLQGLELIDEYGNPTDAMDALRRASSEDFRNQLEELVREVYAEVFKFADPATDDAARVADAFRAFNPIGQRGRAVTLFLGLCEAAGIIPEGKGKRATIPRSTARITRPSRTKSARPRSRKPEHHKGMSAHREGSTPPAIAGLLAALPTNGDGWTEADRQRFLDTFTSVLDFSIPVRQSGAEASDGEE